MKESCDELPLFNTRTVSQVPGLFAVMDEDNRHVSINKNMAELFGYSTAEAFIDAGGTVDNIRSPVVEICEQLLSENQNVLHSGKACKYITIANYADNQTHYIYGVKAPLSNNGKQFVIYNFQDITGLKRANMLNIHSLLKAMKHQLQLNNHSQGSLMVKSRYEGLGMTTRQSECAFLLTIGKTAREIAELLCLSKRTVEHHIEELKHSMNCHSRSELVESLVFKGIASKIPERLINKLI